MNDEFDMQTETETANKYFEEISAAVCNEQLKLSFDISNKWDDETWCRDVAISTAEYN
jgi:hypothetical protein